MGVMKRFSERDRGTRHGTFSREQLDKYNRGWTLFMVDIWQEQLDRLDVTDTGQLKESLQSLIETGEVTHIQHEFMRYGLYAAAGTGKGFEEDNAGYIAFMDDDFRADSARRYGSRQVGAGLSENHMLAPKYDRIIVRFGKNAGKEAALTSGEKRQPKDWFLRKYYVSLRKLTTYNGQFYGMAYMGMTANVIEELFSSGRNAVRSIRK